MLYPATHATTATLAHLAAAAPTLTALPHVTRRCPTHTTLSKSNLLCCCMQVVDALSRHFLSFEGDSRVMPLIWHISLLVFVQRYKHQLTSADRDALTHLTTVQHHYKVRVCACVWLGVVHRQQHAVCMCMIVCVFYRGMPPGYVCLCLSAVHVHGSRCMHPPHVSMVMCVLVFHVHVLAGEP